MLHSLTRRFLARTASLLQIATSAPNFPRACWGQNRLERKLLGAEPDLQQMPARLFLLRIHEIGEVNAAIA